MKNIALLGALVFCLIQIQAQPGPTKMHHCSHARNYYQNLRSENDLLPWQHSGLLNYDVHFYFLDIAADNTSVFINGKTEIHAHSAVAELDTFVFELSNALTIDSVLIDGVKTAFTRAASNVFVPLKQSITQNTNFIAAIFYNGNVEGEGLSNGISNSWATRATWSLSESYHAKDWFPSKEVLSDKADSAYIFITVPDHLMAGSNGLLTKVELADNKCRYEWRHRYPINYYLISIAVSDYQDYSIYAHPTDADSILIQNFIYNTEACLSTFKSDIDEVADMIELLSEHYGLYPFHTEKYGHCMAPFGGGMEHQTMTTQGWFEFGLSIHELGHQWFGNNVTCATWQDIWINEGFASYTEYLGEEFLHGKQQAKNWMDNAWNYAKSENYRSVYIPKPDIIYESRIFNYALSYKKGAVILHVMRSQVNDDEVFFRVLRQFQKQFANGVATGLDFKQVLEEVSGKDFTAVFDEWYFGKGNPKYQLSYFEIDNQDSTLVILKQNGSNSETPVFHLELELAAEYGESREIFRINSQNPVDTFKIYTPYSIDNLILDPNNWIMKTYGSAQHLPEFEMSDICLGSDSMKLTGGYPEGGYYAGSGVNNDSLVIENLSAGNYAIDYTIDLGKHGTSTVTAFYEIVPKPQVNLGADTTIYQNEILVLQPDVEFSQYLWSNGSTDSQLQIIADNMESGAHQFWLEATDFKSCTNRDTIVVTRAENATSLGKRLPESLNYRQNGSLVQLTNTASESYDVLLYCITGKLLFTGKLNPYSQINLNLQNYSNNVFGLLLTNSQNNFLLKIAAE